MVRGGWMGEAGAILQPNGDTKAKACLPEGEPREK